MNQFSFRYTFFLLVSLFKISSLIAQPPENEPIHAEEVPPKHQSHTREARAFAACSSQMEVKLLRNGDAVLWNSSSAPYEISFTYHPIGMQCILPRSIENAEELFPLKRDLNAYTTPTKKGLQLYVSSKDYDILLAETKHPDHEIEVIEDAPPNGFYFFTSTIHTKKGKPCSAKSSKAFDSKTDLFFFDYESQSKKLINSFPIYVDSVDISAKYVYFFSIQNGVIKFMYSPIGGNCIYNTLSFLVDYISVRELEWFLNSARDTFDFLSIAGDESEMAVPFRYDIEKKSIYPLLSDIEIKALSADITTFITDAETNKLVAYGEDGLRLTWHTPASSPEYATLSQYLNAFQEENNCNLYFINGDAKIGCSINGRWIFQAASPYESSRYITVVKGSWVTSLNDDLDSEISFSSDDEFSVSSDTISITSVGLEAEMGMGSFVSPLPYFSPEELFPGVEIEWGHALSRDQSHQIPFYLVRPPNHASTGRGIVMIHGGPTNRWKWNRELNDARSFALMGYTVLLPNPRGGNGFGRKYVAQGYRQHLTTVPHDIIDVAEDAVQKGLIHMDRTVLIGGSYGAYMTAVLLTMPDKFPFAAGFAYSGFYNVEDSMSEIEGYEGIARYEKIARDTQWGCWSNPDDRDYMRKASPVFSADKIQVPLVLLHGEKDNNCPYSQPKQMAKALKHANVPYALIKVKGMGHSCSSETVPIFLALQEKFLAEALGGEYEELSKEARDTKKVVKILKDTTGFYNDFF